MTDKIIPGTCPNPSECGIQLDQNTRACICITCNKSGYMSDAGRIWTTFEAARDDHSVPLMREY